MTTKGRVGWEAARALAATGLFRLLPEADGSTVTSAVRPFVPSGGSVAIAFTRDARAVVLILDDEGRATGVAKVARDAAGRAKLAQEADRLRRFAPLLEPPVSAPRLLAAEDGLLMLEPIAWRPRRRPWLLPMDVAMGMGRFHALTVSRDGEAGHPGHGDLAPWNVMRSSDGWVVLDWEEAMPAAPPYEDPFHYLVQAHALLGRPRRGELLAGISGEGWVGRALHAYAQAAHVESTDRPTAFADYLRRSAALLDTSRADGARGVEARRRLLLELGASA